MNNEALLLLDPRGIGASRRLVGRLAYWQHRIFGRSPLHGVHLEQIGGQPCLVLPGVLNPRLMRTGAFFAGVLEQLLPAGGEVLDLGTGSGVCALAAARRARHVVGVDINAAAVRCARLNVSLNRLDERVDILAGDLFEPVAGRRFDVVLFNPPFYRGPPRDDADRAWRSEDIPERFAAGLGAHLRPQGFALLLLSTFGDAAGFMQALSSAGFRLTVASRRGFINERLVVLKVTA